MTDFTVWETAPFGATIDHILQRYHDVHRGQFEELVPLPQKVAEVHADSFPAEVPELLSIQRQTTHTLRLHIMSPHPITITSYNMHKGMSGLKSHIYKINHNIISGTDGS